MKADFMEGVSAGWKCVCLDGSAFDSTQNYLNMDAVDNPFFSSLKPIFEILYRNAFDANPG